MERIPNAPDLIIHHARIFTANDAEPRAKSVAIRHHRIMAVGNNVDVLELASKKTRQIDAGGRTLLPGFSDSHIHFAQWCINRLALPLADARSLSELLQMLEDEAADSAPGTWIVASGWNESHWDEPRVPVAADLDRVTGADYPTILLRSDLHSAVVNSAALVIAGIHAKTPNPPSGLIDRDDSGNPTGVLRESAVELVLKNLPPVTDAQRADAMRLGMAHLHALGITAIHDQRYGGSGEGAGSLRAFQSLRDAGDLRLRVTCNVSAADMDHAIALGIQSGLGDATLQIGHMKFFSDGSLGSRTAWMLEPYLADDGRADDAGPANTGMAVLPPAQLAEQMRRAAAAGFAISVHAIGDRANREVLDIFEELGQSPAPLPFPHRIEHVQTIDPADGPRYAQLGLTASVQPLHMIDDRALADRLLGERTASTYAFHSLLEASALLAFGSDAPVADPNPWLALQAAVTRTSPLDDLPPWRPEQAIDLADAIRAYTVNPARAVGRAGEFGSIRAGNRADLILLDRDIFARDDIASTRVQLTMFDGEIVHEI